jgi:hypothetical protein
MMLVEAERKLARAGISLWLVGLNPAPLERVRPSPLGQTLGSERLFPNLGQAVGSYLEEFDGPGRTDEYVEELGR